MASPKKSISWQDMRRALSSRNKTELLNLIRDLYVLSPENKDFVHERFLTSEPNAESYQVIIGEPLYPDVTDRRATMRQWSKLRCSREQWKRKARQRANDNHYLRKELARIKQERDRHKHALKATQVNPRLSASCSDEKLLYLMIVDPSQSRVVRERESAEVSVAMEAWAQAFSAESPDNILSFYSEDTVFWGTQSPVRRNTSLAIQDYYAEVFTFTERKVSFTDPLIRVYGDVAVNTGYYTFSWIREGQVETVPARYSITYVKRDRGWSIVDHHSSVVPKSNLCQSQVMN